MTFLTSISFKDLERLREVVRKVHMAHYADRHITTREMDMIIETMGPDLLEQQLKSLVDQQGTADTQHGAWLVPEDLPDKKEGEVR